MNLSELSEIYNASAEIIAKIKESVPEKLPHFIKDREKYTEEYMSARDLLYLTIFFAKQELKEDIALPQSTHYPFLQYLAKQALDDYISYSKKQGYGALWSLDKGFFIRGAYLYVKNLESDIHHGYTVGDFKGEDLCFDAFALLLSLGKDEFNKIFTETDSYAVSLLGYSIDLAEKLHLTGLYNVVEESMKYDWEEEGPEGAVYHLLTSLPALKYLVFFQKYHADLFSDSELKLSLEKAAREYGLNDEGVENEYNKYTSLLRYAQDYIDGKLTEIEYKVLDTKSVNYRHDKRVIDISAYSNNDLQIENDLGINLLHIAILANNHRLMIDLLNRGFSLFESSGPFPAPIHLFDDDMDIDQVFYKELLPHIPDVDMELHSGNTIADILGYSPEVISKSSSSLYVFNKKDIENWSTKEWLEEQWNQFNSKFDPTKTHIGIVKGYSEWSIGMVEASREIVKKFPNVEFFILGQEIIEKLSNEKLLGRFDGFVLPGAGDSYPNEEDAVFSKQDWKQSEKHEEAYQAVLEFANQNNVPMFGSCAGAQNMALYHGGFLQKKGYYKMHNIMFNDNKYSMSYFANLLPLEKQQAILQCVLPDIEIKGDAQHSYSAISSKLGEAITLGGVGDDSDIAMAYDSNNGTWLFTQYHPEFYYDYKGDDQSKLRQQSYLDHFIKLTIQQHNFKDEANDSLSPAVLSGILQSRLQECASASEDTALDIGYVDEEQGAFIIL